MTARWLHSHLVWSTPADSPSSKRAARSGGEFDGSTVNTAVGILIARHGVDARQAETLLRANAYAHGLSSTTVARRLIDTAAPCTDLT
ncbi:ANTAR domain-containing protein [Rhodococcoides kroppenstedtii]|jgi:hypothetical protein|uniref:ANTAR domain-containing protein n=1 Tax=Rhodococcoides kroppenstedtii TaxID=293050 RepID=UPI0013A93C5D|nr:ANTAR domain-containing protein [Rhodococcus kroppenstedtii]MSX06327.1 ANTAR domain-containing protein [Actinomycetota bacterium]